MLMRKSTILFAIAAIIIATTNCSTFNKSAGRPIEIKFKGEKGQVTHTMYSSTSRIKTFSDGQLAKDRTESVDFTVRNSVTEIDNKENTIKFIAKTIKKDGTVQLTDMAFPELNDSIEFVIKTNGEVLRAGAYPSNSIFFVPAVPIPNEKVSVGDTWTLEHTWTSAREGIPLKISIAAILKDIVSCESNQRCADLEISGGVRLAIPPVPGAGRFQSRIWGRMLFNVDRGEVIWSHTRGLEEMVAKSERVLVNSCMISAMEIPSAKSLKIACEPKEEPVTKVPRL